MISLDFTGKNVLVTGGTRGIGRALAEAYRNAGAHVIITGTKSSLEKADKIQREFEYIPVDFSDKESLDSFLNRLGHLDRIDVCVNNAGINRIQLLEDYSIEDFDKVQEVNVRSPFLISKTVAKSMVKNQYGRILNISSIWGTITKAGRSGYTTAKTGIIGLTRTLAVELAPYNVLVNALSPGFTLTELTRNSLSNEEMKNLSQQIPIQRMAEPAELASLALFLSSDSNTYLTGQNITIDGGYTIV